MLRLLLIERDGRLIVMPLVSHIALATTVGSALALLTVRQNGNWPQKNDQYSDTDNSCDQLRTHIPSLNHLDSHSRFK
jgi:hypothetical protein